MVDRMILTLLIIGGANCGSIGLFEFDIISWLLGGQDSTITRVFLVMIGLSAIWCISFFIKPNDLIMDD